MINRLMRQTAKPDGTARAGPRAGILNANHRLVAQPVTLTATRFVGRLARNLTLTDYRE